MDFKSNGWTKFIPECFDNRDLPEEEQMAVDIHWLNNGEKKRYADRVKGKSRKAIMRTAKAVDKAMFVENAL